MQNRLLNGTAHRVVFQAGLVDGLDEIVKEFLVASAEDKSSFITKAEEVASTLEGSAARFVLWPPFLSSHFSSLHPHFLSFSGGTD